MPKKSNPSTPALLRRIGRSTVKRIEAGTMRYHALALAAALVTIAVGVLSIVAIVDYQRTSRIADGTAREATASTPIESIVLWNSYSDSLTDSREFEVHYFTPLGDDAPLPPGMETWLKSGEVLLSPNLRDLGADEGISDRFGTTVGSISSDKLADPNELLAYVRPAQEMSLSAESPGIIAVSGWGSDSVTSEYNGLHWVLHNQDFSVAALMAIALTMLVLPSLVFTVAASHIAVDARRRRTHILDVLGARRRHRVWIELGEAARPIAVGAACSSVVLAIPFFADFSVPFIGYTVRADDIRSHWWAVLLAPLIGVAICVIAVVLAPRRTRLNRAMTRPRPPGRHRRMVLWAYAFPFFVMIAVLLPRFFMYTPGYMILNWIGTIGAIITLPAVVGVATRWFGKTLAKRGRASHKVDMILAGRRMQYDARSSVRQSLGILLGLTLFYIVLAYQGVLAGDLRAHEEANSAYGSSTVQVRVYNHEIDENSTTDFLDSLPEGTVVVGISRQYDEIGRQITELVSSCEAIAALDVDCLPGGGGAVEFDARTVSPLLSAWTGTDVPVRVLDIPLAEAVSFEGYDMLLIHAEGSDLPIGDIKASGQVFQYGVDVSAPGAAWLSGSIPMREQSQWVGLFGVIGVSTLALVAAIGSAGEFIRHGSRISPVAVMVGRPEIYRRVSAWTVLTPLALAALAGTIFGIWITRPLVIHSTNLITLPVVLVALSSIFLIAVVMWQWSTRIATRYAYEWRPGSGKD